MSEDDKKLNERIAELVARGYSQEEAEGLARFELYGGDSVDLSTDGPSLS